MHLLDVAAGLLLLHWWWYYPVSLTT